MSDLWTEAEMSLRIEALRLNWPKLFTIVARVMAHRSWRLMMRMAFGINGLAAFLVWWTLQS